MTESNSQNIYSMLFTFSAAVQPVYGGTLYIQIRLNSPLYKAGYRPEDEFRTVHKCVLPSTRFDLVLRHCIHISSFFPIFIAVGLVSVTLHNFVEIGLPM